MRNIGHRIVFLVALLFSIMGTGTLSLAAPQESGPVPEVTQCEQNSEQVWNSVGNLIATQEQYKDAEAIRYQGEQAKVFVAELLKLLGVAETPWPVDEIIAVRPNKNEDQGYNVLYISHGCVQGVMAGMPVKVFEGLRKKVNGEEA